MQKADEVPEGCGADCRQGSGRFRCSFIAFLIMHQNVSQVSLAKRVSPQFENRAQIFTSHLPMMDQQDQVTLTNWPASKKKFRQVPVQIANKVPEGSGAEG